MLDVAKKVKRAQSRGGRRKGAGRPTVFDGKRVKLHVKVTDAAFALVEAERQRLEPDYGHGATVASAVESLLWKGSGRKPRNLKPIPDHD